MAKDELTRILDELATKVHNLVPGDIGSMDRVLVPIAQARVAITKYIKEQIIGEDEERDDRLPPMYNSGRNRLRDEQRAKLKGE